MSKRNYYAVLGIARTASPEQIRQAFRNLARESHPDLNPDSDQAEERFKEVAEAYSVLSDPEARRRYDHSEGETAERPAWPHTSFWAETRPFGQGETTSGSVGRRTVPESDPFAEIVETFFGFSPTRARRREGYRRRVPQRGADITEVVEITLEEACTGTDRVLEITDGLGNEYQRVVDIPPGVEEGHQIRIAGEGEAGRNGGPPGDLFLEVRILPHSLCRRRGDDLHVELPVRLTTAVLGGQLTIPLPDGALTLDLSPDMVNSSPVRIEGKGMPQRGSPGKRGDLYVTLRVQVPKHLSPAQEDLFRRLAKLEGEVDQRSNE